MNARYLTGTAGEFSGVSYWDEMLHSGANFVADYPVRELHVILPVELTVIKKREL